VSADNQVFLATLGVLAGLIAIVSKLVVDRRNGNGNGNGGTEYYTGPERRKEMQAVKAELESLRSAIERNASGIKDLAAQVTHRFDRVEEHQRRNDTQTAREIGQLIGVVQSLEKAMAANQGYRGETRTTPPGGEPIP